MEKILPCINTMMSNISLVQLQVEEGGGGYVQDVEEGGIPLAPPALLVREEGCVVYM